MQKLSKEQGDWLIEKLKKAQISNPYSKGIFGEVGYAFDGHGVFDIINQCTEKEFPAFSFETQDHRIISMHQVVNRAALNNEFFLDKAELMHLVLGIEKIIDWMEENE